MRINNLPNLRTEDFPSEQKWINKLFIQLNPFFQSINQLFLGNIDFIDNIKSVTSNYDITTFQAFSLSWPFTANNPPVDLRIIQALKGTEQTPTILLPAWQYDKTRNLITVSELNEISAGTVAALSGRYRFTLRATV